MKQQLTQYADNISAVADAAALKETFWVNPAAVPFAQQVITAVNPQQIEDARARLERFAPYIRTVFPETAAAGGSIESPLLEIGKMYAALGSNYGKQTGARLLLKMDSHLPIAGSIKARGGIYEVLHHAEQLAMDAGLLRISDDYSILAHPQFCDFFSRYTVQVGSTGNLGMSIGIMSAKLGFKVMVHMSADAKQWKKDLLRSRGVTVLEYPTDYCAAVEEGRRLSDSDPMSYFVDDENSVNLFMGYSVAGKRLQSQLEQADIAVDSEHPLFVYLPCGIGGAPGGVAYGLNQVFGDNVHCFFTEPTQACCMLLGMATGLHDAVSVQDFDITGKTDADGLAVGRPSAFVGRVVEPMLRGICTIDDHRLYQLMHLLLDTEQIFIEPSACAAFAALVRPGNLEQYIATRGLQHCAANITHVAWATGGSMVPKEMIETYLKQ